MNTRFGNTGNMKKGSSVSPRSAAWKPKNDSGVVALEATTPRAIQKTFGPERQVPHSAKPFLLTALMVLFHEGRYGDPDDRWHREHHDYPPAAPITKPAPQDVTGDEIYQRRLAMGSSFKPPSQSTPSASVTAPIDVAGAATTGSPIPARAETGEEAYLRRVAMSQGPPAPPSQAAPAQPPPSTGDEAYHRHVALPSPPPLQPHPTMNETSDPSDSSGYNPFAPQSAPPPPSSIPDAASTTNVPSDFEERVRSSRNAAAAIAAKFSAFTSPAEGRESFDPLPEEITSGPSTRCAS